MTMLFDVVYYDINSSYQGKPWIELFFIKIRSMYEACSLFALILIATLKQLYYNSTNCIFATL